jgi:hypothetical protein
MKKKNGTGKAAVPLAVHEPTALQKLTAEFAAHNRKNSLATREFRQKQLDQVLAHAGVDLAKIERRHDLLRRSDERFLASKRAAMKKVSETANRQAASKLTRLKAAQKAGFLPTPSFQPVPRPLPDGGGGGGGGGMPQPVGLWLLRADTIEVSPAGLNVDVSMEDWYNLARFVVPDNEDVIFTLSFNFSWTPPHDGMLDCTAFAFPVGFQYWATKHPCIESDIYAILDAELFVLSTDKPVVDENVYTFWWDHTPSSTNSGFNVIDPDVIFGTNMPVPVQGGVFVQISVAFTIQLFALEVTTSLDFSTNGNNINVPGIVVNFQPT